MVRGNLDKEQIQAFETLTPLLNAAYEEIQELAKRKPEGPLNQNKVKVINRLLVDITALLSKETSVKYLDLLDQDTVPVYSDVALSLSQYSAALEQFRCKYSLPMP